MADHINPIVYLKNFTDLSGKVWIYERSPYKVGRRKPEKIAKQKDYYSYDNNDGTKNRSIEDMLQKIETPVPKVLQSFIGGNDINEETRQKISLFIASSFLRTRFMRRTYHELEMSDRFQKLDEIARNEEQWSKVPPCRNTSKEVQEKFRGLIIDGGLNDYNFEMEVDQQSSLNVFQYLPEVTTCIYNMSWVLLEAPEDCFFVTSDTPVINDGPPGSPVGLTNKCTILTMPLSPKFCWSGSWRSEMTGKVTLKADEIRELNLLRIIHAEKEVYCHKNDKGIEELLEFCKGIRHSIESTIDKPEINIPIKVVRKLEQET